MICKKQLDAKIAARNKLNAAINANLPRMIATLIPLIGKKIQKTDGTILEKIKPILPIEGESVKAENVTWHYSIQGRDFKVFFKIHTSFNERQYERQYDEATFYIAKLDGGILKEVCEDREPLRTDFSAQTIQRLRNEVKEARRVLHDKESELRGFGEWDN
jgi:hypothetical protein